MSHTELLAQIRTANAAASRAYRDYYDAQKALIDASIDPLSRDAGDQTQITAVLEFGEIHAAAALKVHELEAQLVGGAGSGMAEVRRLGGRLPIAADSAGEAGAAFAEAARTAGAVNQPSGGIAIPSLLESRLAHPVAPGGYRAAVDVTGGGGVLPRYAGTNTFSTLPHRRPSLLELIPMETTGGLGGETLQFLRQTVYTNLAAATAMLAAKPVSVISVERATTTLFTVATISEQVPRQLLSAYEDLHDWVEGELSGAVLESCEAYTISGAGGGTEPTGILTESIGEQARGGDTAIDAIRKAITSLEEVNVSAEAIAMNPADWETFELETDGDGRHLFGNPGGRGAAGLWRLPVYSTNAIAAGTALVGNFSRGAKRWSGSSRLMWSESVDDDFAKNAVRFLAETGFGFAVLRTANFVKVTGL